MNKINLKISKDLYPKSVLLKTCFHFLDTYYIYLDADDKNYFIEIASKDGKDIVTNVIGLFFNELIAQNTRFTILEETANIRKIALARAYSSTIVEDAKAPEEIKSDETSMFKDWFDKNDTEIK